MKAIVGLILGAFFLFVGVNLLSPIQEEIAEGVDNGTYSGTVGSLTSLVPIVFTVMIVFGVVRQMSGTEGEVRREKVKKTVVSVYKNSRDLILRIETASKKNAKFIQNMDELLGVTTKVVDDPDNALKLIKLGVPNEDGRNFQLDISSCFDWYIADKHPNLYMFKIVGLHKKDNGKNVVCIIGKDNEHENPYLIDVPIEYLETKFQYLSKTNW
jgi:hypothetical protein